MKAHQTAKVYSFYSHFYDAIFGRLLEEGRKNVFRLTQMETCDSILEVGIGTGLTLKNYPFSSRVHGLDISEKMISKAKKRLRKPALRHRPITLLNADAAYLPYRDEVFDLTIGSYVLTTVSYPETVLKEMIRVTKKNGRLILLNHFMLHEKGLRHRLEQLFSPLCTRMGFRTDLRLDHLAGIKGVEKEHELTVNPFQLYKIIQLRKYE